MKYFKAVLIGLTQGLTEFLPVSSSGHLILMEKLTGTAPSVFLNLTLHLATLFAVVAVMRKEVWAILSHPFKSNLRYVALSSAPTAVIALLLNRFFPSLLLGGMLPFGFLLTAATLFSAELFSPHGPFLPIGPKNSFLTGVAQGVAALPGVSRSGVTVSVMRLAGVSRESATSFSFILSLPVIAGGFIITGAESGFSANGADLTEVLVASAVAFVSGVFALRFMLKKIKNGMTPFAVYTLVLGVACFFLI